MRDCLHCRWGIIDSVGEIGYCIQYFACGCEKEHDVEDEEDCDDFKANEYVNV